ncbi:MAG: recombinase family protein [Rhodobacteraceae bacterium]|nr:recombinase family protein [Paracoccaceae bacterium]
MQIAVIYARISGDQRKTEDTIASQTAVLIAFAGEHGYGVAPGMVYEDDGYTGATLERPGLERVRGVAAESRIGAVPVHDRIIRATTPLSNAA